MYRYINAKSLFLQIAEQDETVLLLKEELKSQAGAMEALNAMVDYKQTALENLVIKSDNVMMSLIIS